MYQNIYNYFFEYDLSKTPGFTYVLANFLGVIIYTAFNPRRRKNIWAYAELLILGLMYLVYNFFTRDISTVLFIPSIMIAFMFTALMIYAVCDMNRRNVIYYAVRAYTFGELAGALGWQLVCYVFENRRVSYSAAIQCLITVGTVAVLFVIVLLAEKRINRDQKHIHIEKREVILSAVMCICMIAASNLSYVSSSTPFSSRIPSDIYIIRTIVDLAGVSILTAYHIILKESHEKMEMAAVSVMKKRLTFKSRFFRSALRFVSRTRASIFRWNFSEGWKSSFISSKLGIRASSQSCASVTIIAIRASGEIRILSSFITIFLQSGQNDFTRSVQTNFYISGRNVEKIGNLADLVALNF